MQAQRCSVCLGPAVLRCSRCRTWYCSPTCQTKDWALGHRAICTQRAKAAKQEASAPALGVAVQEKIQRTPTFVQSLKEPSMYLYDPKAFSRLLSHSTPAPAVSCGLINQVIEYLKQN